MGALRNFPRQSVSWGTVAPDVIENTANDVAQDACDAGRADVHGIGVPGLVGTSDAREAIGTEDGFREVDHSHVVASQVRKDGIDLCMPPIVCGAADTAEVDGATKQVCLNDAAAPWERLRRYLPQDPQRRPGPHGVLPHGFQSGPQACSVREYRR